MQYSRKDDASKSGQSRDNSQSHGQSPSHLLKIQNKKRDDDDDDDEEEEKKPKFKSFGSIVGVSSYSTHQF
jgi:hypothetical protein